MFDKKRVLHISDLHTMVAAHIELKVNDKLWNLINACEAIMFYVDNDRNKTFGLPTPNLNFVNLMSHGLFCISCGLLVENELKVHMPYINHKSKQMCLPCVKEFTVKLINDEWQEATT